MLDCTEDDLLWRLRGTLARFRSYYSRSLSFGFGSTHILPGNDDIVYIDDDAPLTDSVIQDYLTGTRNRSQIYIKHSNRFYNLNALKLAASLPPDYQPMNWPEDVMYWEDSKVSEAVAALPDCLSDPRGSQWRMAEQWAMPRDGYYLKVQWIRVPGPPLPEDVLMQPRYKSPVTAASIPHELHDLILHHFVNRVCKSDGRHECHDELRCELDHVRCTQSELGNLALVCRRWTRPIQSVMFSTIELSNGTATRLSTMLKGTATFSGQHIQSIDAIFDGVEHLRKPCLHHFSLLVMPKLSGLKDRSVTLELIGPLPKKHRVLSSIHPFPRSHPCFSAGIQNLWLEGVHFSTFAHLVRLIKQLPSVDDVHCRGVTWDTREGDVMYPTSFLSRDDLAQKAVSYRMQDCTDDAGAAWLGILLGQTRTDILNRDDAELLCAVAGARKCVECTRWEDEIWFGCDASIYIHAYLTPRAGIRDRRRIRAIALDLWSHDDDTASWPTIDAALASLTVLEVVLFVLRRDDTMLYLEKIAPLMPLHARSPRLRFALQDEHQRAYTRAVLEDDEFRKIGEPSAGAGRYPWTIQTDTIVYAYEYQLQCTQLSRFPILQLQIPCPQPLLLLRLSCIEAEPRRLACLIVLRDSEFRTYPIEPQLEMIVGVFRGMVIESKKVKDEAERSVGKTFLDASRFDRGTRRRRFSPLNDLDVRESHEEVTTRRGRSR
ncbi:hypothetical protein NM688_g9071 [Phlebia brevispora]|uniref:Uncharacterized protein n=1 Tax=Phlebia brevispora TaxID=194682 RepID=A0ACC1RNA0_9APHY|nr:hypothetical protein NM688_g9071 [Phlebia brevispora]